MSDDLWCDVKVSARNNNEAGAAADLLERGDSPVSIETEKLTDQKNALLSDLSNTEVDLTQSEEKLKSLREQVENEAKTYLPGEMVTTNVLIENIETMRLREGIDDVELRAGVRRLAVGDVVRAGTSDAEVIEIRS